MANGNANWDDWAIEHIIVKKQSEHDRALHELRGVPQQLEVITEKVDRCNGRLDELPRSAKADAESKRKENLQRAGIAAAVLVGLANLIFNSGGPG